MKHQKMELSNLYSHQKRLLEKNPERCLISHGTGCGKTRTTIELAYKNCSSFLVICPKALKENWRREIEKWGAGRGTPWKAMTKEEFRKDWNILERFDGSLPPHHISAPPGIFMWQHDYSVMIGVM